MPPTPTSSRPEPAARTPEWRIQLREAIRDPDQLIDRLGLPDALRPGARRAAERFAVVVPEPFLARMRHGDPDDPLLRQVLPLEEETVSAAGFDRDPVGDLEARLSPGLIQKYHGRALLVVTGVCAVACRYCFRRHFPYHEGPASLEAWEPAFRTVEADPSLEELILSGGDPLMRDDAWLTRMIHRIDQIPHVRRIRVHTRLPIVIPDRVTEALLETLTTSRCVVTVVVHANHPQELDAGCSSTLRSLVDRGIPVFNQAVLLRGINDSAEVQVALSKRLLESKVTPYYLHQLDPVEGAAHFEVETARGVAITDEVRGQLPGLGSPRYVRDDRSRHSKTPLQ